MSSIKETREENGLIIGKEYVKNEAGQIDWRKMLDPKWLYINPSAVKSGRVPADADPSEQEDRNLCILLGGLKELATIRGYDSVSYKISSASKDYVCVQCRIEWIKNPENPGGCVFEGIADAHPDNTKSFAQKFLASMAENRAFSRSVRSFLQINIVSDIEMGDASTHEDADSSRSPSKSDPLVMLGEVMKDKKVSFEALKAKLVEEGKADDTLSSLAGISGPVIFEMIGRLKNKSIKKK